MKTIDHMILGKCLVDKHLRNAKRKQQKAFLMGCIVPDINPFTYLKGSIKYQKFQGHNYPNSKKAIKRYMDMLSFSQFYSCKDYYRLGKLIHYIADAFTFPHNMQFQDTLKMHVAYEEELHTAFVNIRMMGNFQEDITETYNKHDLFEYFIKTHQEYLKNRSSMQDDLHYITKMLETIVANILKDKKIIAIHNNDIAIIMPTVRCFNLERR